MILDELSQIKSLDKSGMLNSIDSLDEQCAEAFDDLKGVNFPANLSKVKNVVVTGMGGSALGAHIVDSLFFDQLKVSLEIVSDYHLPAYVNKDTLVILSSYSGSTEETLSCMKEVKKKGCKVIVITSGKDLLAYKNKNKLWGYVFTPHFNPCGSPRMGLGYTLFGTMLIFGKLGFIKFGETEIKKSIKTIEKYNEVFGATAKSSENPAKQLSIQLQNKIPIYFASGFLAGNIHTASNQLNENAKNFSAWFLLPEINHHLMEGLVFPESIKKDLVFVFFESSLNETRIQKRFQLTKEVAKQKGISVSSYQLQEKTKLGQVFELLTLGSYISFYLAMLYNIDPTPIPVVDWFKKQMG